LSFDETDLLKKQTISTSRLVENMTAGERVSFALEKDIPDDDKEEVVYNSIAERM